MFVLYRQWAVQLTRSVAGEQQVTAIHDFGHNQLALEGSNLPTRRLDW